MPAAVLAAAHSLVGLEPFPVCDADGGQLSGACGSATGDAGVELT